jgi:hypothetical protein
MSPIEFAMLRDRVIDWMAEAAPVFLQDDVLLEGMLFIVCREVARAVCEERESQQKRVREVSSC